MIDPFTLTMFVGGGLVICGYALGRWNGYENASASIMTELFQNKLADPTEVLRFYANQGNARAQLALEKLNLERKKQFDNKAKDDAQD